MKKFYCFNKKIFNENIFIKIFGGINTLAAVLLHRRSWFWLIKLAKHAIDWVTLKDNDAAGDRCASRSTFT